MSTNLGKINIFINYFDFKKQTQKQSVLNEPFHFLNIDEGAYMELGAYR
jgi:hypothetical protein